MFPIFIILFSPKSLRKISATSRGLHPLANALCLDLQRHHLNFSMASPSKNGCRANSLSKVGLIDPQGTIKRLFTTCCGEILQFSSSLWKLWYELLKVIISSPAWLTNWSYIYIYIPCNLWCDLTFMEAGNHNRSSLECVPKCSIDLKERNMLGRFSNVLLLWQERDTSDIGP